VHVTTTDPLPTDPPADLQDAPPSRTPWVGALVAVAVLGLMAYAFILSHQEEEAASPGANPPAVLSDVDKYGNPRTTPAGSIDPDESAAAKDGADVGGCGQLDPDHPPEIEFLLEDGTLHMGEMKQGVRVEREVAFRNAGTGPLCVAKVSTGCGCLKAKLMSEKKRFEPGEGGRIQLVIDTTGRVGTIRKQVTMTTNAVPTPLKSFRVDLKVSAGLIAEPRYLQFGSTVPHASVIRYLILRAPKDDPAWTVTGLESVRDIPGREKPAYIWKAEEVEDPRYRKFKVQITHPGYEEVGPVRDIIRVKTTHPDRPAIEVSAHINVVARILSRSRVISLGFVRPGTPRPPMRARIQPGMPGIEFELTKVDVEPREGKSAPPGGLGFLATVGKDDRGWWVDVQYDGKARQPGLLEGTLVVHTSDQEQPELRVPIRATIRATH
jgi:hypothetical protein